MCLPVSMPTLSSAVRCAVSPQPPRGLRRISEPCALAQVQEAFEKQGNALQNMSRANAVIESEKAEYLAIFSKHNLDNLAIKKPGMIELRFNNGSEKVMEGLEDDTKKLYSIDNPTSSD